MLIDSAEAEGCLITTALIRTGTDDHGLTPSQALAESLALADEGLAVPEPDGSLRLATVACLD